METDMLTSVKGMEFNYVAHGVGPTLVLIHAFPLNLRMWEPQIKALSDVCHVVAMDLRGFGASQTTDGDFILEDLARDVQQLMYKLGHQRIILGGLSMGGYVALQFLKLFPDQVRGLILADTRAWPDTPEGREKRFAMIDEVNARGVRGLAQSFPQNAVSQVTAGGRPELVDRLKTWILDTEPATIVGAQRAMANRPDFTDLLPHIKVPTLVMVGEEDAITPPAEAERMAQLIHGAQLAKVPGAGHLSNLENPEAFNQAVKAFMHQFVS